MSQVRIANNYFAEMCGGSEAGSYLRLIDFVYHSTLGLRVINKKTRLQNTMFCFKYFMVKNHILEAAGYALWA